MGLTSPPPARARGKGRERFLTWSHTAKDRELLPPKRLDVSSVAEIYDSVQVCKIWVKLTLLPRIMMFCKGGN